MYEEQRLMAAGVPFSEASGLCKALRREAAMGRLDDEAPEETHNYKCGGIGNCPGRPNRNR